MISRNSALKSKLRQELKAKLNLLNYEEKQRETSAITAKANHVIKSSLKRFQSHRLCLRLLKLSRFRAYQSATGTRPAAFVADNLLKHPHFLSSRRISVYLSTDSEVGTDDIVKAIFIHGKQCFIPRYRVKNSEMEMVKVESLSDIDSLPATSWNIKQPALDDNRENALDTGGLDLVILPGLGFGEKGERLGKGKGFYDRFLRNFEEKNLSKPYCVGLAFKVQMVLNIPMDENDFLLDEIITA